MSVTSLRDETAVSAAQGPSSLGSTADQRGVSDHSEQTMIPLAPFTLEDCGLDEDLLWGIATKLAATVPRFATEWMVAKLRLATPIVTQLLERLRREHILEVLGQSGPFNQTLAITDRGREQARRLSDAGAYSGPAPVSLRDYECSLAYQFAHLPMVEPSAVLEALQQLVLDPAVIEIAGLAARSRRSLFLYGPPGNGKTTLGHLLHESVPGTLWIPYAIAVDGAIIRVFDQECHVPVSAEARSGNEKQDQRWVQIRRPFIVVGGELTINSLELAYSSANGCYEAPLHFKANGGTFLLDDFGCQRSAPAELLNRWIHPLERQVDFLTLQTGQQIRVPFQQMLIISTNLDPQKVVSPAFLRRMGYRLELRSPTTEQFREIFRRYAAQYQFHDITEVLDWLMLRYRQTGRTPAACEARDLIERTRDLCSYRSDLPELTPARLEVAWMGYFGG